MLLPVLALVSKKLISIYLAKPAPSSKVTFRSPISDLLPTSTLSTLSDA